MPKGCLGASKGAVQSLALHQLWIRGIRCDLDQRWNLISSMNTHSYAGYMQVLLADKVGCRPEIVEILNFFKKVSMHNFEFEGEEDE
jgi:hypothetical protein